MSFSLCPDGSGWQRWGLKQLAQNEGAGGGRREQISVKIQEKIFQGMLGRHKGNIVHLEEKYFGFPALLVNGRW